MTTDASWDLVDSSLTVVSLILVLRVVVLLVLLILVVLLPTNGWRFNAITLLTVGLVCVEPVSVTAFLLYICVNRSLSHVWSPPLLYSLVARNLCLLLPPEDDDDRRQRCVVGVKCEFTKTRRIVGQIQH